MGTQEAWEVRAEGETMHLALFIFAFALLFGLYCWLIVRRHWVVLVCLTVLVVCAIGLLFSGM